MFDRNISPLIVTALILLAAIPAGVTAQSSARQPLLLNQHTDRVGTVSVADETYTIYRYDNTVPYASGIAVYRNGEPVNSEAEARRAVRAYAQQRAIARLGADDLRALRSIRENVSEVQNASTQSVQEINRTLAYLSSLEKKSIDGNRTASEAARDAAPELEGFNRTLRERRNETRKWDAAARAVTRNATRLAAMLERKQADKSVNETALLEQYEATLRALERFQERSETAADGFHETAATSRTIAAHAYGVPEVGPNLADRFIALSYRLGTSGDRISRTSEAVGKRATVVRGPAETADSLESRLMDDWHSRRNAPMEVYGTLIGVPIAGVAVAGYIYKTRI